jgi:hypothetical protein
MIGWGAVGKLEGIPPVRTYGWETSADGFPVQTSGERGSSMPHAGGS